MSEDLTLKSREELELICKKLNIRFHPNAKDETLREKINAQPVAYQDTAMQHVSQRPVEAVHSNTPAQIEDAIRVYAAKDGFTASFDEEENTWHFKYKGREECGNMNIPLRIIKMKAENVAKGPVASMKIDRDASGKFLWA